MDGGIVTPGVADAQIDMERGVVICTADLPYIDTSKIASPQFDIDILDRYGKILPTLKM